MPRDARLREAHLSLGQESLCPEPARPVGDLHGWGLLSSGNSLLLLSQALPVAGIQLRHSPWEGGEKSGEYLELGAERLDPTTGKGPGGRFLGGAARDLHLEERTSLGQGPSLPSSCPGAAELRGDLAGTLPFPGPQFSRRYTTKGKGFLPDQMLRFLSCVGWGSEGLGIGEKIGVTSQPLGKSVLRTTS